MSALVLQEGPDAEGISRITLNRPAAGNALTLEMVNALSAALFRLGKSSRVVSCGASLAVLL
jgi:enoyl-CoA hydratase/carnithine racemase